MISATLLELRCLYWQSVLELCEKMHIIRHLPLIRPLCASHHTLSTAETLSSDAFLLFITQNGQTPLHWACFYGHVAVAEKLIANGADVEAKDEVRNSVRNEKEIVIILSAYKFALILLFLFVTVAVLYINICRSPLFLSLFLLALLLIL